MNLEKEEMKGWPKTKKEWKKYQANLRTTIKKLVKPKPKAKGFKRTPGEWEESVAGHIGRFVDKLTPEMATKLGLWGVGTVVVHRLNIAGLITYFGRSNDYVDTGLPYPFGRRIKFPWEAGDKKTWEDYVCEWGLPAIISWMLVYKPEAVAQFVDAMIPF